MCFVAERCLVQSSTHAQNIINQDRVELHHTKIDFSISAANCRQSTQIIHRPKFCRCTYLTTAISAAVSSSTEMGSFLSSKFGIRRWHKKTMNCRSQATATFNFHRHEKRAISCSIQSSSSTTANANAFELFSKTMGSTSEQATPGFGQFHGSSLRNSGPVNQISDLTRAAGVVPLETRSAGFCFVGTCLQFDMQVFFSIKARRRATKDGNRLLSFRMLCKTTLESVQNTEGLGSRFSSFFTERSSSTAIIAAIN